MAAQNDKRDLTQGPVWRKLAGLTLPMIFGIMAVISVSLVDTYFVGLLGTEELAALSFTFPVTMVLTSLSIGLGAGAASVVSRAVGGRNRDEARRLATDSLILAIVMVAILSGGGYFAIRSIFALLGADGNVLDLIVRYMSIWVLSLPFVVVPMVANSIIRAAGDALWPSLIMIGIAIINAGLTPLMIFGWGPVPAFGIEGAALATLIAYVLSLFMGFYLVAVRERMIAWRAPPAAQLFGSWRRVLGVGLPASAGSAVNPLGITVVTSVIAALGAETVAAFGVATRLEAFATIPMLALSASIGPMAGQNWGAGRTDRVIRALQQSFIACGIWSALLAMFFWALGRTMAGWLAPEANVADQAVVYLSFVPISLWGFGVTIIAAGAFNALGRSVMGLGFYLIRTVAFYIPLSHVGALMGGASEIFIAVAISNGLAGLTVGGYALWWLRKSKRAEDIRAQVN